MVEVPSAVEPTSVLNIRLNWRTSVQLCVPLMGHTMPSSRIICFSSAKSLAFIASL